MASTLRPVLYRSLFAIALTSLLATAILPGVAFALPLVAITKPTNGATVSGIIWIDVAFRSDSNKPISRLEIYIDDTLSREMDLASPVLEGRQSFNWDFTYAASTVHKIGARAIDTSGAANTAAINVSVQGAAVGGPDRIPPVVRIYYPAQGAKLRGPVEVKAEAQDNVGVELVYFYVDGRLHKMMMKAPPYVDLWDTTREQDGIHQLEAVAVDAAENEARSAQVTVVVENNNMTLASQGAGNSLPTGPVPVTGPDALNALPTVPPSTLPAPTVTAPSAPPLTEITAPAPKIETAPQVLSGPVTPKVTTVAPKVADVAPRVKPLEPVPSAPGVPAVGPTPTSPVAVRTSRPDTLSSSALPRTPLVASTTTLTRPTLMAMKPEDRTSGTPVAKSSAPSLQPVISATASVTPAVKPTATTAAAQPVRIAGPSATLATAGSATAPTVGATALAPLSTSSVTPRPTWQTSTLPSKASTLVANTLPAPRSARSGLAPVASTEVHSAVVPVGPTVATVARPVEMAPIMAVAPSPSAGLTVPSRVSSLTPGAPSAPVAVKPVAPAPVKAAPRVATLTRPSISPATLGQAILAGKMPQPIPAGRMLARLPEASEFGLMSADGRTSRPSTLTAAVPVATALVRDIQIVFDGEILTLRTAPETRKGLALAPLREIFERTDGMLYWFPVEKRVHAVNKNVDLKLTIGQPQVSVNGETKVLEVAPYIKQGRTMVPLQFIAETLDVNITFDSRTGNILICSNQQ